MPIEFFPCVFLFGGKDYLSSSLLVTAGADVVQCLGDLKKKKVIYIVEMIALSTV
jgi:hypothetical protein